MFRKPTGAVFNKQTGRRGAQPLRPVGAPVGRHSNVGAPNGRNTATAVKVRRRSTSRSVLGAAIFMLFLAGAAGVAIMAAEERGPFANQTAERWYTEHLEKRFELPSIDEARGKAESASQAAERHFQKLRRSWSRELDKTLSKVRHETRTEARQSGGRAENAGTVLLLQDLSPTTDRKMVDALCAELEYQDFVVLGNPADGIGDERDILYLAGARKAVGVSDPGDEEALYRLKQYLAENPSLDALIWLSSGNDPDTVDYRFVRPLRLDEAEAKAFGMAGR